MIGLRDDAGSYLRLRRSLGYKLVEHERFLAQFLDYLDEIDATTITVENALAWARLPSGTSPRWHAARLSAIRGFAAWAHTFDPEVEVPPKRMLPLRTTRATPYLYSADQVRALLDVAADLGAPWRAATFQTLIGLLTVTGMRIGEAIRADVTDLDVQAAELTVRTSKYGKTRLLPLHPSTIAALRWYLVHRGQPAGTTTAFFLSATGTRLTYSTVHRTFRELTVRAGIRPRSTACRPRLHDYADVRVMSTFQRVSCSAGVRALKLSA